ncbi:MAG TPA: hypothetical protein VNF50_01600 [Acidimicrobiales bacterium]|nr:hypothetical protein [Acidimicrobiales bacterium]
MGAITYLATVMTWARMRLDQIRADESGSPTLETVIIAGVLATAAITAAAIVVTRIMDHANAIQ